MSTLATVNKRYDEAADVLYISVGEPKPAISKPHPECDAVLVRYAIGTRELCGVTIYGFSQLDKQLLERVIPIQGAI